MKKAKQKTDYVKDDFIYTLSGRQTIIIMIMMMMASGVKFNDNRVNTQAKNIQYCVIVIIEKVHKTVFIIIIITYV